jgi:hypothetical protein
MQSKHQDFSVCLIGDLMLLMAQVRSQGSSASGAQ